MELWPLRIGFPDLRGLHVRDHKRSVKKSWFKHLPNLLSAARLVIAPYLFFLLWHHQNKAALAIAFVTGWTDAFDGFLARKLDAQSRLGAYIDPVADKLMLSGLIVTMAIMGVIEPWLAAIVLGRDVLILLMVGAAFAFTTIRSFPPSIWGKASTTAQILFVLAMLIHLAGYEDTAILVPLKWIVAALAAWSGIDYAYRAVRLGRSLVPRQ
jgi:cardiolipin synthase